MLEFIFRERDLPKARITSGYGPRNISISSGFHRGLDIAAPSGTRLLSPADGVVVHNKTNSGGASQGYGHYLVIHHPALKLFTLYAHLRVRARVQEGQSVNAGQWVAEVGNTGNSTGPHVHYEIHEGRHRFPSQVNNQGGSDDPTVDPLSYYPGLSSFRGKSSLEGFSVNSIDTSNVLWLGEVISNGLNVRSGPSTSNSRVRRLSKGDMAEVYGETGSSPFYWLKVGDGEYVSNARGEYVSEVESKSYEVEVTTNRLNVRKGPGTNFKQVKQLEKGDQVNVLAEVKKSDYTWLYLGNGEFIADGGWTKKVNTNTFRKGDKVKVKPGSGYASFVYDRVHVIQSINESNKTALVTFNGSAMDWVPMKNLIKQ